MDDKLIRLARKVKTLEDELSKITQIKDLEGLLVASNDMNSRYKKSINETVGMYKEYISNTKKELTDSFEAIKKDYDSKKDSYKKNMNNLEAKINKVKDDIQKVCTSIDKSIEDIQKDILKDIKDKNTQILNEIGKKDKELKEVKNESASLVKDLKALKDLVNKLELQKGDDGKSAYDIACELGFKGTKEEWIKSLHGKDGQDIELRGLRAFSDVKNDNKMYARKNKKWVEVENYDDTEIREDIAELQEENEAQTEQIQALQTENTRLKATLPTTTGTGENITLQNTAELEFIQPPLPRGNSEQVQYSGKNLLNYSTMKLGFVDNQIKINDSPSVANKGEMYSEFIKVNPNTTYIFSIIETSSAYENWIGIGEYSSNNINDGIRRDTMTTASQNYFSFTTSNNTQYIIASARNLQQATKVQLEQGSTATSYEPYCGGTPSPNPSYPQSISNVTGDVEVLLQNKNLFDKDNLNLINGYPDYSSGTIIASSANRTIWIHCKPSTTYTVQKTAGKRFVLYYSETEPAINSEIIKATGTINNTGTSITKASTDTSKYLIVNVANYNETGELAWQDVIDSLQIEENTTATTYTPHQEQTLPLTLGNIELCKIGDYQDYFYKENSKWYLYKAISKVVYNGSENWGTAGEGNITDGVSMYLGIPDALSSAYKEVYCNYFKYINRNYVSSSSLNFITGGGGVSIVINTSKEYLSEGTTTGFKTWLGTHNITVLYPLATPTITEITDTTLINQLEAIKQAISYEEQTNISGSSDESNPLFSVEAYQSIKLVLAG